MFALAANPYQSPADLPDLEGSGDHQLRRLTLLSRWCLWLGIFNLIGLNLAGLLLILTAKGLLKRSRGWYSFAVAYYGVYSLIFLALLAIQVAIPHSLSLSIWGRSATVNFWLGTLLVGFAFLLHTIPLWLLLTIQRFYHSRGNSFGARLDEASTESNKKSMGIS